MKFKLKLVLIAIAIAQLGSLCSIFLGIVGGFESTESKFTEDKRELEFLKINNTENDEKSDIDSSKIPDKVVLMIIDALRVDMMTPDNFPFLLGNLKKTFRNTGILEYRVTVDSPTVTLPRVKVSSLSAKLTQTHCRNISDNGFYFSVDTDDWKIPHLPRCTKKLSNDRHSLYFNHPNQPRQPYLGPAKGETRLEHLLLWG